MRKFLVYYRMYQYGSGEYVYCSTKVGLECDEKANTETFIKKLNMEVALIKVFKEVLSWSLIED